MTHTSKPHGAKLTRFRRTRPALAALLSLTLSLSAPLSSLAAPAADSASPQTSGVAGGAGQKPAAEAKSDSASDSTVPTSSADVQASGESAEKPQTKPAEPETRYSLKAPNILKGRVISESPYRALLLDGVTREIPKESKIDLTIMANLNSEVTQIGNEIYAKVSIDVKDGQNVIVPEGWYIRGIVTDVKGQKRLGRDGYIDVEFDKLVSPDEEIELPFAAKVSTKDGKLKSVAKHLLTDSRYVAKGALGGSILSVQMTGIPLAIATHGYSVAGGAAIGATLGAFGAMHRKGKIASLYPGDVMKVTTAEPISLPGFDMSKLAAMRAKPPAIKGFALRINKRWFDADPLDKRARYLRMNVTAENHTGREFRFSDLAVVSDFNQRYEQTIASGYASVKHLIKPESTESAPMTFSVDGTKRKYYLILLDRGSGRELSRVPIN